MSSPQSSVLWTCRVQCLVWHFLTSHLEALGCGSLWITVHEYQKNFCVLHIQSNTTIFYYILLLNQHNGNDAPKKTWISVTHNNNITKKLIVYVISLLVECNDMNVTCFYRLFHSSNTCSKQGFHCRNYNSINPPSALHNLRNRQCR